MKKKKKPYKLLIRCVVVVNIVIAELNRLQHLSRALEISKLHD